MREKFSCDMSYLEDSIPDIDRVKLNFGITTGIDKNYIIIHEMLHSVGFGYVNDIPRKNFILECLNPFIEQLKKLIKEDKDFLTVEITSIPAIISTEDEDDVNWIVDSTFHSNHRVMLEYRGASSQKKVNGRIADIVFNKDFTKVVYSF